MVRRVASRLLTLIFCWLLPQRQVLEVLNETIDEYHTSSDAGEGASEKSSGFFSRFKRDKVRWVCRCAASAAVVPWRILTTHYRRRR